MCEGAIIVDREARIVWISDKYAARLKLGSAADAVGRVVEDVIPNSLMREVVRTGEPMHARHHAVRRRVLRGDARAAQGRARRA